MLRDLNITEEEFSAFVSAVNSSASLREALGIEEVVKITREDVNAERIKELRSLLLEAGSRFPIDRLKSAEIKTVKGKLKETLGYSAVIKYLDKFGESKQMKQDFTRSKLNYGTPSDWHRMAVDARLELLRIIR